MQDIIVIGVIVLAVIIACICIYKDKKKCASMRTPNVKKA